MASKLDGEPALEEAFDTLQLTSTERRAYRFLLEEGPSTPTRVAAVTRQSRGRIYETLRLLVERGLAREEPSRPIRYAATSPHEAVRIALAQAERQSSLLRRAYGTLAAPPAEAAPRQPRTKPSDLVVVHGRRQALEEMRRACDEARTFIHLEGGGHFLERLAADKDLLTILKSAKDRRVRISIHHANDAKVGRRRLEGAVGAQGLQPIPRASEISTMNLLATERVALWLHPQPDDASTTAGNDVGFRATSAPFASELAQRYEGMPAPSGDGATARSDDVPTAFAQALQAARTEILSFDAVPRALLASLGPRPWDGTGSRGIALRALVAPDDESGLRPPWQVRVVPWTPSGIVLVDRRELYQVQGATDGRTSPALRSTREPSEVRFYVDLFERLWNQAPA